MISNRSRKQKTVGGMNHRHMFVKNLLLFFITVKELYKKNTKNTIVSITKYRINYESIINMKSVISKSSSRGV